MGLHPLQGLRALIAVTASIAFAAAVCGPDLAFDGVEPEKKMYYAPLCWRLPPLGFAMGPTPCKDYER